MRDPVSELVAQRGFAILDGAMATELEARGADLSGELWSARVLIDQPALISDMHRAYFDAGADIAITATYQASIEGFAKVGVLKADAARLMHLAVRLARNARVSTSPRAVVATSVGPYGAVLADGSEYRGDYGLSEAELIRFHASRLELLAELGVEVFACETIPSFVEAQALVTALREVPDASAWLTFTARDETSISDGTPIIDCVEFLDRQDQIIGIGVNCTPTGFITPLIRAIRSATAKPIVVYPNSGEAWDSASQSWSGRRAGQNFGQLAEEWYEAGARIIGGCCRTGPADIASIAEHLKGDSSPMVE
jgi:homocysteine S-methyltransferase